MRCPELCEGQSFPVWATPLRRACLAVIANVNLSATRLDLFTGELFNLQVEEQIDHWKADDRDARSYQEKLERRKLHSYISTRQLHKLVRHKRGKKRQAIKWPGAFAFKGGLYDYRNTITYANPL